MWKLKEYAEYENEKKITIKKSFEERKSKENLNEKINKSKEKLQYKNSIEEEERKPKEN